MNSPSAIVARTPSRSVTLADRFTARSGDILISGVQAIVRLMLVQADRDRAAGLNTGGFVSGYRGSPLGTLDSAFDTARDLTQKNGIVVRPAVNEELGATAVAGSQQINMTPGATVEGVFALWYGKGPGVDRAADALRHGNYSGASAKGGVVMAVGDDHMAKSSTVICNSDKVVAALNIPLFFPSDPAEIVEFGLHAFAMSRHTGSWAALKIVNDVADSTRTVSTDELARSPVLPAIVQPPMGMHNQWPEMPLDQETRQIDYRFPAVAAYVRANGLDRALLKSPQSRIGVVSAGKPWLDVREALKLLALDDNRLSELGVALYKPAMIWPLEADGLNEFASGLETLIVIEEKDGFLEQQIRSILYGLAGAPSVMGKHGPDGAVLFPATGDLSPERIAAELGGLLATYRDDDALMNSAKLAKDLMAVQATFAAPPTARRAFFCSGCPHNRSTNLPEGSRATAGIGCHGLAAYNRSDTAVFASMGSEGVHWMGLGPFTNEKHVFANLGDGTYFHSGILAIRQAVASKLNITYKLLYNSAVAMTGGQSVDGELSVAQVADQLRAEGVSTIVVATDDPSRYPRGHAVHSHIDRVEHRDDLEALQIEMRATKGVSVIIYEQMCATEKRRLRKRGKMYDPTKRVFINELVCEGCGDCSVKSNCLSVEPVQTDFGQKRRINQSTCNKDYSCQNGFCPSFVSVEGARPRKKTGQAADPAAALPLPITEASPHQRLMVAGVGGTGVVTIGALVSMATYMRGGASGVLDQIGIAQKGGAVVSHVHLSDERIDALRIPPGQADVVIACDLIVGNARDVMAAIAPGRTFVVANADTSITGDFTQNRDATPDATFLARRMKKRAGDERFAAYPFSRLAENLLGDAIGSNLMMVGFAWQQGWISVDLENLNAAIELNGTAVEMNKAAFGWGRKLAHDPAAVFDAAGLGEKAPETLDDMIDRRVAFLTDYQNAAYADRFRAIVDGVRQAELAAGGKESLTRTAAQGLFRLMAYKDEYEVARLYTDGSFNKSLNAAFDGDFKLTFHMAPPLLARRDKVTGHLRKREFGRWILPAFKILASMRGLRGTAFDPFGRTKERRTERAMIEEYITLLGSLTRGLCAEQLEKATAIAALILEVRGYGHIKDAAIARYREKLTAALNTRDSADPEMAPAQLAQASA